jgi:hypothetical protein
MGAIQALDAEVRTWTENVSEPALLDWRYWTLSHS